MAVRESTGWRARPAALQLPSRRSYFSDGARGSPTAELASGGAPTPPAKRSNSTTPCASTYSSGVRPLHVSFSRSRSRRHQYPPAESSRGGRRREENRLGLLSRALAVITLMSPFSVGCAAPHKTPLFFGRSKMLLTTAVADGYAALTPLTSRGCQHCNCGASLRAGQKEDGAEHGHHGSMCCSEMHLAGAEMHRCVRWERLELNNLNAMCYWINIINERQGEAIVAAPCC